MAEEIKVPCRVYVARQDHNNPMSHTDGLQSHPNCALHPAPSQIFTCYMDDEEIGFEDLLVDDSLTLDKQGVPDQVCGYLHPLLVVPESALPVRVDEGILLEKSIFCQLK